MSSRDARRAHLQHGISAPPRLRGENSSVRRIAVRLSLCDRQRFLQVGNCIAVIEIEWRRIELSGALQFARAGPGVAAQVGDGGEVRPDLRLIVDLQRFEQIGATCRGSGTGLHRVLGVVEERAQTQGRVRVRIADVGEEVGQRTARDCLLIARGTRPMSIIVSMSAAAVIDSPSGVPCTLSATNAKPTRPFSARAR